jgi:hypothetical protein
LLDDIVRDGARRMLAAAPEAEVTAYVDAFVDQLEENGRRLAVRNGHAEPWVVLTSSGAIGVRAPRVNDKRARTRPPASASGSPRDRTEGTIGMSGRLSTLRSLFEAGLLDELVPLVDPLVVSGERRWTDELGRTPLELVSSETFPTGVLHLVYRPAQQG